MYSSTLSLTSALHGVGGQRHDPAALPLGVNRYPLYRRLFGPQGRSGRLRDVLASTGIRSPAHPARSESQNDRDFIEVIHVYLLAAQFCTKQAKVCAAGCGRSWRAVCVLCRCRRKVNCPFSSVSLPGCVVGLYVSVGTAVIISWCFYF
jgi:hypothetical protein